jgi:hypothetical protein
LLDFPPLLCGSVPIPDSVEILALGGTFRPLGTPCSPGRTLTFGIESRLAEFSGKSTTWKRPSPVFLQFSTRSLKLLRMNSEFEIVRQPALPDPAARRPLSPSLPDVSRIPKGLRTGTQVFGSAIERYPGFAHPFAFGRQAPAPL